MHLSRSTVIINTILLSHLLFYSLAALQFRGEKPRPREGRDSTKQPSRPPSPPGRATQGPSHTSATSAWLWDCGLVCPLPASGSPLVNQEERPVIPLPPAPSDQWRVFWPSPMVFPGRFWGVAIAEVIQGSKRAGRMCNGSWELPSRNPEAWELAASKQPHLPLIALRKVLPRC